MNSYKDEIAVLTEDDLWNRFNTWGGSAVTAPKSNTVLEFGKSLSTQTAKSNSNADSVEFSIWETMMNEYKQGQDELEAYKSKKAPSAPDYNLLKGSTVEYLETNVFAILFPAMTKVLIEAIRTDQLSCARSTFDPLDSIAQALWNNNPKFPQRVEDNLSIYDMPWAQKILREKPRPRYPQSWTFSPDDAAVNIQSFFRGYTVRKDKEVQEMRQFWKVFKEENQL